MKKEFTTKWKGSKLPKKQRKFVANAPMHLKRKFLSVNLSKDLRKEYGRNVEVRKGDTVKVMRGKFKGKEAKVIEVKTMRQKIYLENMQKKKSDGSKVNVPFRSSNLQIIQLNKDDKKRFGEKTNTKIKDETKKETTKKQSKVENKQGDKK